MSRNPSSSTLPKGFRPAAATDAELVKFGFPPRPTSTGDGRRRIWVETFGRNVSFALAQFSIAPQFASRPRQVSTINSNNSTNWSGVVVQNEAGDPINPGIAGTWNVPAITSIGNGTQSIGIWIGIDGYDTNTPGLLQAGIGGAFDSAGQPVFFAWSEWLSTTDPVQPARPIANFSFEIGDTIEAQIWVTSPTTATVVMLNLSRPGAEGAAVIVPLVAPPQVSVVGSSAEWIVERPLMGQTLALLPDYASVNVTKAAAWSQSGSSVLSFKAFAIQSGFAVPISARAVAASIDFTPPISLREMMREAAVVFAGSGEPITMEENGIAVSSAHIQSEVSFLFEYVGPAPGQIMLEGPPDP
jgi:hypothetical protein